jgi:hypothetical protein
MSQMGQSRPNRAVRTMSGLLPLATELRTSMVVWFVPIPDFPLLKKSLSGRTPDREGIMRKRVHMSVHILKSFAFVPQPKFNGDPLLIKRERRLITDAPYRHFSSCHFGEG